MKIFYYPDLVLTCDQKDRNTYFSSSPCLIIEVLSDTTERIERRGKFAGYQTLPSLREYLLVSQDSRRVEIFRRSSDWQAEYIRAREKITCAYCAEISLAFKARGGAHSLAM